MAVHKDAWTVGPFKVERGKPLPFGATQLRNGINFSLFSKHATENSTDSTVERRERLGGLLNFYHREAG